MVPSCPPKAKQESSSHWLASLQIDVLTCAPLRGDLQHQEQVLGARPQVGCSKALRGKGRQSRQQPDDRPPDLAVPVVPIAEHRLNSLAVARQHELP